MIPGRRSTCSRRECCRGGAYSARQFVTAMVPCLEGTFSQPKREVVWSKGPARVSRDKQGNGSETGMDPLASEPFPQVEMSGGGA
jgi:hypothetical protein